MTIPVHNLCATHIPQLNAHFDALDPGDTHLRFGNNLSRVAKHLYVESIDFTRDSVFGVYADDLTLLGVAHLASFSGAAELGLSVLPAYRSHGVGSALFDRGVTRARNLQVVELFMHCIAHNNAIMHIARKAGMKIVIEDGDADAYLELPADDIFTHGFTQVQDIAAQGLAQFDLAVKEHLARLRRLTEIIR